MSLPIIAGQLEKNRKMILGRDGENSIAIVLLLGTQHQAPRQLSVGLTFGGSLAPSYN